MVSVLTLALHTNARACVVKRAWSWMVVVAVDSDASYQDEDESLPKKEDVVFHVMQMGLLEPV